MTLLAPTVAVTVQGVPVGGGAGGALPDPAPQPPPPRGDPRHEFTINTGASGTSVGYNQPGGFGSLDDGSFMYDTPDGTTVTIVQCRSLQNMTLVFVLNAAGLEPGDIDQFPGSIRVTRPGTAGVVDFTRPDSARRIGSGIRADYTTEARAVDVAFTLSRLSMAHFELFDN